MRIPTHRAVERLIRRGYMRCWSGCPSLDAEIARVDWMWGKERKHEREIHVD